MLFRCHSYTNREKRDKYCFIQLFFFFGDSKCSLSYKHVSRSLYLLPHKYWQSCLAMRDCIEKETPEDLLDIPCLQSFIEMAQD